MVIDLVSGDAGGEAKKYRSSRESYGGLHLFFLMEFKPLVPRQLRKVRDVGRFLIGFGIVALPTDAAAALSLVLALDT
jgi:hypothetical protein